MNTSEVLNRAADLIEEHGWGQGTQGWPKGNGDRAPLCLEGGIIAALGKKWYGLDLDAFWSCPAYRAVQSYLDLRHDFVPVSDPGVPGPVDPLYRWNDSIDRTASEVIEVLRAVAVIEAARETEAVEVVLRGASW